ncbi:MAG: c-type cytochrome biogenesis protein CcsB [Armatimonadota bacterium]
MTEHLGLSLFKIAFWVYLAAAACYVHGIIKNQKGTAKLGRVFLLGGLVAHTAALVIITVAIGRPPFLNLYEYMMSFTWAAAVVYVALELSTKNSVFGGFCVPLITAFVYFTQALPNAKIDDAVMPALRSAWRVPHISSAILAYASFGLAFVLAIMFLIREGADTSLAKKGEKGTGKSFWATRLPTAAVLDQTVYRMIAFGFLMQTLLVVVGAIWAQFAWGRYWGWDPKETWSLITWLIYATYLHTRTMLGWRGRKSAWLAIFGFGATIFTLLGVSFIFHGLHSYAAK